MQAYTIYFYGSHGDSCFIDSYMYSIWNSQCDSIIWYEENGKNKLAEIQTRREKGELMGEKDQAQNSVSVREEVKAERIGLRRAWNMVHDGDRQIREPA